MISEKADNAPSGWRQPPLVGTVLPPQQAATWSTTPRPRRTSVFGKAPLPDQVCNVSFERIPWGGSIGYAIIANGFWLGTLAGEDGNAFLDYLFSVPRHEVYGALIGIARGMAADLHGADDNKVGTP